LNNTRNLLKDSLNRVEQVKKAITMQGPEYVPILFFNKDFEQSDIMLIDVVRHFTGENKDVSEWGFTWERHDETMGQPKDIIIKKWDDINEIQTPNPYDKTRFYEVQSIKKQYGSKYYLASLVLSGFSVMTFLRGFSNTMIDIYADRDKVEQLADMVFSFEEGIICQLKDYQFNGVAFFDDWGTQNGLLISPDLWRDFFKLRYKCQIDLAHSYGLDVYFHSCGYIMDIIPDLIEIGVDMVNISQPNLYDIEVLGREFGGKVCFVCPISYQTTSITGNREDIYSEAKKLIYNLGGHKGGFIGYVEEYRSIGMSDNNYNHCINAFRKMGKYF
jgi:uroporphyrinogen decarboxylase